MKILLKSFDGSALGQKVIQKLQASLSHWADRLGQVVVRIVDLNGPKGGVDKACSILVEVPRREPLRVTAIGSDYVTATNLAIHRLGRVAYRAFNRRAFQ
ncbi:hypothetical protein [Mesoterricola sediminis]|uniref:HPF/RaiA family ribosome-associated protein n=1 Tax=Mesoterricola sediminis TaxID=2927980 RepID=A0AA48KDJ7_9BACT|nr:hypothetical protein [Mesoterricola sediminis]BDU78394.1 hypothetical protein METESE_33520 [Mesoterricola sediminis]